MPIAKFLEAIEKSGYPVEVSHLSLRKRVGEPDSYDVQVGLSAYDRIAGDAGLGAGRAHTGEAPVKERLRERLTAIATAVGYPVFYVFCLVLFASWTFPFDKVRDRVVASFNESQRASGSSRELAITEVSSSWLTGLRLTGVRITDRDAERGDAKSELKIDSLVGTHRDPASPRSGTTT